MNWFQDPKIVAGCVIGVSSLVCLRKYFNGGINRFKPCMKDRVAIITGSNTGIGYETALSLSKLNCTVILGCRDIQRGQKAEQSIKDSTQNNKVFFMKLDLCDKQSVEDFSIAFKAKFNRLDLLVNNAGVMVPATRISTKDNLELQVGTNHFGHFYLTYNLIEVLCQTEKSRIINVSSMAHRRGGKIDFNNFNSLQSYDRFTMYGYSKLANIFFSRTLAEKYPQIKTVSLHPGVVKTELGRYLVSQTTQYLLFPILFPLSFFLKSSNAGAQTSLACSLMPYEQLVSGQYYSDCQIKDVYPNAINTKQDEALLWDLSCKTYNINW